jgi:hypothetical protein
MMHPETKTGNETKMVFRGTFLGLPVYSPETISVDATTPASRETGGDGRRRARRRK